MNMYPKFNEIFKEINSKFESEGCLLHTDKWQATDIKGDPSAKMVEVLHHSFMYDINQSNIGRIARELRPNLPWAEDHFMERVCGQPINPGLEWANWPWANSADSHREPDGTFNHNYMERYWPKHANGHLLPIKGIRHEYGDLNDLLLLLAKEPDTRQAYMPIWFPEDTGITHSGRKPCSLGYHFIMRNGELDVTYQIRSCDYYKHFRDDIYLTIRLLYWVLEKLKMMAPERWSGVEPGTLIMHTTSLHLFVNDYIKMFGKSPYKSI